MMAEEDLTKNVSFTCEMNEDGDTVITYKNGIQLVLAGLSEAAIKDIERAKKENTITTDAQFMAEARKYLPV